ncbi:beta-ketoacyl synthase chain length factor [Fulvivirga ligni]|uniref:beta-ketoacyl synthase chain length factor n=1 Tax=Fulvivirga ligni TaxID=2904246 RepID=UPI001F3019A9|nr:beta-ketoacyl synthase chain length factor [Fulvivirga ligni]UII22956.1 beta-ketoacyl synthase chain length factor [Fulvivirga ligni]
MKVYIKSTSAITPQFTFDQSSYLKEWLTQEGPFLSAHEPDYKALINPRLLRRMSRIIKMGVATSLQALKDANVENPGAIIVGTGLGCIQDTEKFLVDILESKEGILSPTAFIQSTHNTVAGQIALLLKCTEDNFTYVNRGHSFENSLQDAVLRVKEGVDNVLVGGADEMTNEIAAIIGEIKCNPSNLWGEGASFFVLSKDPGENQIVLNGISTANNLEATEITGAADKFLNKLGMSAADIDAVVIGGEGSDPYYSSISNHFTDQAIYNFKAVTGENFTASSFGLNLGVNLLQNPEIDSAIKIKEGKKNNFKTVLMYNHYRGVNHTFALVSHESL